VCPAVTPTPRGTSRRHGEPPGARAPSRSSVPVHGVPAHGLNHAARPHEAAPRVVAKSVDEDLGNLSRRAEQKRPRAILEALPAKQKLVEVTGFNAAIGRNLFPDGEVFHWDTRTTNTKGPNGRYIIEVHGGNPGVPSGLHHATPPHLQVQLSGKVQVRIFMPPEGV